MTVLNYLKLCTYINSIMVNNNINLSLKLISIMEKIQQTTSCHQKYQSVVVQLFLKADQDEFYQCLEKMLQILVSQDPRHVNPYIDRAMSFSCLLYTAPELNNLQSVPMHERILNYLLEIHDVESTTIRYRVCQIISKILKNLTEYEINEVLCDQIQEAMLERVKDSKSEVRSQAISAMYLLQNVDDLDCDIVFALISSMTDVSAKVRKIAVEKICVRRDTLTALIMRSRDIIVDVRRAAYLRLLKLVKFLKISERQDIIVNGFADTSETIQRILEKQLVPAWLTTYDNDVLVFLQSFRLDSNAEDIEKSVDAYRLVLNALFRIKPYNELFEVLNIGQTRTLPYESLNWESAIYWRYLIEVFQKSDKFEAQLDSILPDFVHFSKYIKNYYNVKLIDNERDDLEFQFVLNQLFTITQGYDLSDSLSRRELNNLVTDVLNKLDLEANLMATIIKNLEKSLPKLEERSVFVCEIISNIMYPISQETTLQCSEETHFKIAQRKVELNCLKEKLDNFIKLEDYQSASGCKTEIDLLIEDLSRLQESLVVKNSPVIKKTDPSTMMKCLNITRGLLISPQVTSLNHVLNTLCNDLIMDQMMQDTRNDEFQARALECFTLCCIVDRALAEKGLQVFSTYIIASKMNDANVGIKCLEISVRAMVDLLSIYGKSLWNAVENNGSLPEVVPYNDIVQMIVDFMDHEMIDIQTCSARGLCLLIISQNILSSSLLVRMILKWCNPADDAGQQNVRQIIGRLLEYLSHRPGCSLHFQETVIPTIKTLLRAPKSSPLADVNVTEMAKFLLAMCSACDENSYIHENVAGKLLTEIVKDYSDKENLMWTKMLLMLDISADAQVINELFVSSTKILEECSNLPIIMNLKKFNDQLTVSKMNYLIIEE